MGLGWHWYTWIGAREASGGIIESCDEGRLTLVGNWLHISLLEGTRF